MLVPGGDEPRVKRLFKRYDSELTSGSDNVRNQPDEDLPPEEKMQIAFSEGWFGPGGV
jgi:hypothetical protein